MIGLLLPGYALEISDAEARAAGKRIWQNECSGRIDGLTSWNRGEQFASLGIGHFIWYPKGQEGPFEESFPGLVEFLEREGVALPGWLKSTRDCPWSSRDQFQADFQGERMKSLRRLLSSTVDLQARYIAIRLQNALPKMTAGLSDSQQALVSRRFNRLASSSGGLYPLIDYVNFKGEGTNPKERYQGQGWGLLQVLLTMEDDSVVSFSRAAETVLRRRVANSPPERNEKRWLQGWTNRARTYRP